MQILTQNCWQWNPPLDKSVGTWHPPRLIIAMSWYRPCHDGTVNTNIMTPEIWVIFHWVCPVRLPGIAIEISWEEHQCFPLMVCFFQLITLLTHQRAIICFYLSYYYYYLLLFIRNASWKDCYIEDWWVIWSVCVTSSSSVVVEDHMIVIVSPHCLLQPISVPGWGLTEHCVQVPGRDLHIAPSADWWCGRVTLTLGGGGDTDWSHSLSADTRHIESW